MDKAQGGSKRDSTKTDAKVQVKSAPGIHLTPDQVALLGQAFPNEETILVKQEFRSGYSGAVVVLVSVGVGRAPMVVKMAHPHDLQREYEAYEEYVRQVSPQNIAHLQGEPMNAPDGQLGLLQYTFAGGESHLPTTSLQEYFEASGAEATSAVLNRIFRVYGRHWWANNRAQTYVLDEHYDRLLPVHLQASRIDESAEPDHVVKSGESSILAVEKIAIGQTVQLLEFQVIKARDGGHRLTLMGQSPPSEASAPIRVRVEMEQPTDYKPGDVAPSITARVSATRQTLLGSAAQAALRGFDPQGRQFTLSSGAEGGDIVLPNPLLKLPELLYRVVETKMSIIHGDLNLQNVLVDGPTGFAWLIDFAETRVGPTLLDLQRLEVQAITKLLPAGGETPLSAVVEMMTRLHADPPLPAPPQPQLREPYALLVTIRRLARQYLIDDLDWNEYYYGLVVALIGALKYDELDSNARRMALVCAAAAESLVGRPLQQASSTMPAPAAARSVAAGQEARRQPAVVPTRVAPAGRDSQKPAVTVKPTSPATVKTGRHLAGPMVAAAALLLIVAGLWWISTFLGSGETGQSAAMETAPSAAGDVTDQVEVLAAAAATDSSAGESSDSTSTAAAASGSATSSPEAAQVLVTEDAGESDGASTAVTSITASTENSPQTPIATGAPTETAVEEAEAETLTLLATVNVRAGPGASYPIVGTLRIGTVVEAVGRSGSGADSWYQIANPEDGDELVWVSGNPQLVDASGAEGAPEVTPAAVAAATPAVNTALAGRSGTIYYSATDSSGADNIYWVAADGYVEPELVVSGGRQPAHQPNGDRLAFKSVADSALGIGGIDGAGQNRTLFSSNPEDSVPSWNPGGDRIIFTSNREGDRDWRLYVTWPESGGAFYQLGRGADPDWHPTRDLIVFKGCDDFGARCGLWTMATGGTARQPLTDNPSDSRPRWSPDGQTVVFMSAERHGNWELYAVDAGGGEARRLTNDPASDGLPAISPDGQYVAFLSSRGGSWGVWAMPLRGGEAELVVRLDSPLPDWLAQGLSWTP